jgi:hypothetical protein
MTTLLRIIFFYKRENILSGSSHLCLSKDGLSKMSPTFRLFTNVKLNTQEYFRKDENDSILLFSFYKEKFSY